MVVRHAELVARVGAASKNEPVVGKEQGVVRACSHLLYFLIFEPDGLAHRWKMIKAYWKLYPFSY